MGTRASTTYHTVILAFTCATSRDDLRSPWDMSPTSQESSNIHQKQKQHMESQSVFYHFWYILHPLPETPVALLIIAPGSSDWGESLPARDGEVQLTPVASQPWIFLSHGWPAIPWSHNFISRFSRTFAYLKTFISSNNPLGWLWKIISAWTLDRVGVGKPQLVSKSSNILTYQDIFLDFSYEAFGTLISPEGLNAISIEVLKLSKIHVAIVSNGRTLGMEQISTSQDRDMPCLPVTIGMDSLNMGSLYVHLMHLSRPWNGHMFSTKVARTAWSSSGSGSSVQSYSNHQSGEENGGCVFHIAKGQKKLRH